MKKNLTIFVLAAVLGTSCARKESAVELQPASEPVPVRESAFKPVSAAAAPVKPAPVATPAQTPKPILPAGSAPVEMAPQRATTAVTKAPAPTTVTLAEGTVLAVRVGDTLTSEKNESGDSWTGVLAEPVVVNGLVIAERGAEVTGRVSNVKRSGKVKGVGTISVTLSRMATADGQRVPISTTSFAAYGKDETKRDVGKVAIASGIGAAIGAIAGGGKGAAIGAGAGAGAGTGVVLATRGKPAVISNEALIRFKLAAPVTVTEKMGS